uniref:Uncharacterized protein n=1 Tax=Prymnesium polylepis TaxID=72548 RepID=A0A7S4HWX5_9EUKA
MSSSFTPPSLTTALGEEKMAYNLPKDTNVQLYPWASQPDIRHAKKAIWASQKPNEVPAPFDRCEDPARATLEPRRAEQSLASSPSRKLLQGFHVDRHPLGGDA